MQCLRLSTQDAIAAEPPEKVNSGGYGARTEVLSQQYQQRNWFKIKVAESEPLR
jgi:hypothetical protein